VLNKLAALYTQLGDPDASVPLQLKRPPLAARVYGEGSRQHLELLAQSADMLAQLGRSEEALQTLTQVEGLLQKHRDPSGTVQLALDLARAVYHNYRDDGLGVDHAERAITVLQQRAPSKDLVSAQRLLGSIHYNRGRFEPARQAIAEALATSNRLGAEGISVKGTVLVDLADAEMRLGHVDAALSHYREAAEASAANQGPGGRDAVMLAGRYGQSLIVDGQLQAAVQVLERAAQHAEAWDARSDRAEAAIFVLGNWARALRAHGRPERALDVLDRADAVAAVGAQESPVQVGLAIYRAQVLTDLGQYRQAAASYDRAEALVKRHGHAPGLARNIERDRARWLLAQGKGDEALQAWTRATQQGRTDGGATNNALRHAEDGEFWLGAKQTERALSSAELGLAELTHARSWGDGPHRERLLSLKARALLLLKRPAEALPAAQRAFDSMRRRLDEQHSIDLALAACTLSRALAINGQPQNAAAHAALARAIAARHVQIGLPLTQALGELRSGAR
jgi:tetratricopeptide (TPR) repeat protein